MGGGDTGEVYCLEKTQNGLETLLKSELMFRSVESDSTDRCSGSSSSSSSNRTVFMSTNRTTRPVPASIHRSAGCPGKLLCTCLNRCRGPIPEKVRIEYIFTQYKHIYFHFISRTYIYFKLS